MVSFTRSLAHDRLTISDPGEVFFAKSDVSIWIAGIFPRDSAQNRAEI